MEDATKKETLDALLRRRQVLSAIYEKRRLKPVKTSSQQVEHAVSMPHNNSQRSISSDNSDVIENSDPESPAIPAKKPQIILDSTNNTFSTSVNTSDSLFDDAAIPIYSTVKTSTNKNINIISNIVIKKSKTKQKSTSNTDLNAVTPLMCASVTETGTLAPTNVDTDHNVAIVTPLTYNTNNAGSDLCTPADLVTDLNIMSSSSNNADAVSPALSPTIYANTDLNALIFPEYNVNADSAGLSAPVHVYNEVNITIPSKNNADPVIPTVDSADVDLMTNTCADTLLMNNAEAAGTSSGATASGYKTNAADPVSPAPNDKDTNLNSSMNNANVASPSLSAKRAIKRPGIAIKKKVLDFLSDDDIGDYSAGSSDNWTQENECESSDEDDFKVGKKRVKKFKKQEKDLIKRKKINVNKRKTSRKYREQGKEYETKKGQIVPEKKMQANPCNSNQCKRGCYNITEERRASLFDFFWSLELQRRKDWLVRSAHVVPCARKRTDTLLSRRTLTYEYYVNNGEDHQKVCQKFSQWPSYIEAARKNPKPYHVNVMEYSDFLNWNEITAEMFTTETSKNLKFQNIRSVTFKKKNPNEIYIKYSMKEDTPTDKVKLFQQSGNRGKGKGRGKGKSRSHAIVPEQSVSISSYEKVMIMSPSALYKNKLQISDIKYRDLKRLCDNGIIPKRYHHDYLDLSHGNVADHLTLTDEEDEK